MNDFLQRLMHRNLGRLSLARPMIAPRYVAFEGRHGLSHAASPGFSGEMNEEIEVGSPRNSISPQEGKGQSLTPDTPRDSDSFSASPDNLPDSLFSSPKSESQADPVFANHDTPEDQLPPRNVSDQNITGENKLKNRAFMPADNSDRTLPGKKNLENGPEEAGIRTRRDYSTADKRASSPPPAIQKQQKPDVTGNLTSGATFPAKAGNIPKKSETPDLQASNAGHTPPSPGKTEPDSSQIPDYSRRKVPQSGEENIFDTAEKRPTLHEANAPFATERRESVSPTGEVPAAYRGESSPAAAHLSMEDAMETTLSLSPAPTHPAISKEFAASMTPVISAHDNEDRMFASDLPVTEMAMDEANSESVVQRKTLPGTGWGMKSVLPSAFPTPVKNPAPRVSGAVGSSNDPIDPIHGVKQDKFNPGATQTTTVSFQNRSEADPVAEDIEVVAERLAATQTPSSTALFSYNKGFESGETRPVAASDTTFDSFPESEAFSDSIEFVSDTPGSNSAVPRTNTGFALDAQKQNSSFPRTLVRNESLPRSRSVPRSPVRERIGIDGDRSVVETMHPIEPGFPLSETGHHRPESENFPRTTESTAPNREMKGESKKASPAELSPVSEAADSGFDGHRQETQLPGMPPEKKAFVKHNTKAQAPFEPYTIDRSRRDDKKSESAKESSGPVRVNIGYIDVRSTPESAPGKKTEAPENQSSSVVSLDDYLKRRDEEGAL